MSHLVVYSHVCAHHYHRNGQADCIKLLLRKGVKCVTDNNGVSPVELCVTVSIVMFSFYVTTILCA